MLIAGTDVCGHYEHGEHRIISFIIGKEESINKLRNRIDVKRIHMSKISEYERKEVIKHLDFRYEWTFCDFFRSRKSKNCKIHS